MPINLLALCKANSGLIVKHVKVSAGVQSELEGLFAQQEADFREGVTEEILFDGGWKPEADELLYAPVTLEAAAVLEAAAENITAMTVVNASNLEQEKIRALGVLIKNTGGSRFLIQEFSPRQILARRYNLVFDGQTFDRLTSPTFTIGASLAGIIENGRIKFRVFNRIKLIFDLRSLYKEATDAEVDLFCGYPCLHIADAPAFKSMADQQMRKLIYAISDRGTLNEFTSHQIAAFAKEENFSVKIKDGKLVVPEIKADAKALLYFLDNGLYRAAFGGDLMISNSKRVYQLAPRS